MNYIHFACMAKVTYNKVSCHYSASFIFISQVCVMCDAESNLYLHYIVDSGWRIDRRDEDSYRQLAEPSVYDARASK